MKYLLIVFALAMHNVNAQQVHKLKDEFQNIEKLKAATESSRVNLQRSMDESLKRLDSINIENYNKQNTRNLNAFVKEMDERNKKQKQQMWIRLGFGVAMLVVLIVGLRRKKKKVN